MVLREHTHPVARPGAGQAASPPGSKAWRGTQQGPPAPGRGPACQHRRTHPVAKGAQPRGWRCGKATLPPAREQTTRYCCWCCPARKRVAHPSTRPAPPSPQPQNPATEHPGGLPWALAPLHSTPTPAPVNPPPGVGVNGECHSVTNRSEHGLNCPTDRSSKATLTLTIPSSMKNNAIPKGFTPFDE